MKPCNYQTYVSIKSKQIADTGLTKTAGLFVPSPRSAGHKRPLLSTLNKAITSSHQLAQTSETTAAKRWWF